MSGSPFECQVTQMLGSHFYKQFQQPQSCLPICARPSEYLVQEYYIIQILEITIQTFGVYENVSIWFIGLPMILYQRYM